MFTNDISYLYPPKVANCLLNILSRKEEIMVQSMGDEENVDVDISVCPPSENREEIDGDFVLVEKFL